MRSAALAGEGRACLPLPCRNAHQMFHQTPPAPCAPFPPFPCSPRAPCAVPGAGVPPGRGETGRGGGDAARNVSSCCCRPLPHSCQNALEEIHSHLPEQGSPRRDVTPRRRTMAPRLRTSKHVLTPPRSPRASLGLPRVCLRPAGFVSAG